MSLLFGGGSKVKPQFTGLAVQTSSNSAPVTRMWGRNRVSPNIIWQGDFKANKQKQKAGKGGPSQTTYTYSGSYQLSLCFGPINSVGVVWKEKEKTTLSELGMSLFLGTNPQAPWGYLSSAHPSEALGYAGVSLVAVSNYDLGQSNNFPQHSFEVYGPLQGTQVGGAGDADPAQVLEDFLNNDENGVDSNITSIDSESFLSTAEATTTGDNAYQTYCRAKGFGISPVLSSQEPARDIIGRWLDITNTAPVYTGHSLKFIPYDTESVSANGVVYEPVFPVRYVLTPAEYRDLKINRADPTDSKNMFVLNISDRDNEYNDLPVDYYDQGLIDQFGEKPDTVIDAREVCDPLMAAEMIELIGRRRAYPRNQFNFSLPNQYGLLEAMDVVQLIDPVLGSFTVVLWNVKENSTGGYDVEGEDFYGRLTGSAPIAYAEAANPNNLNTGVAPSPVNAPIFVEPPYPLSETPEVWVGVSGGDGTNFDPNWGGCFVWISTDNVTYDQVGDLDTPSRMGVLSANLAAYAAANPDAVNTAAVDLSKSGGELSDASAADAANALTLMYTDGEYFSFTDATPTGTYDFDLTGLYRGLYGSESDLHLAGSNILRLDDNILKIALPPGYEGQTIYVKFQSYNIFGGSVEDLSTCVAYSYVIQGLNTGEGLGNLNDVDFTTPPSEGQTIIWDPAANGGAGAFVPGDAGASLSPWKVVAVGTGVSQAVTIPFADVDENAVFVFVNGVRYETDEYSILGTDLTLTTNASGDSIEIIGLVE